MAIYLLCEIVTFTDNYSLRHIQILLVILEIALKVC